MNVNVINAADYNFVDFISSLRADRISKAVMQKLQTINSRIQIKESINFSDDRLVLIAFRTLCIDSNDENVGIREWWIANRYFELYGNGESAKNQDFIDLTFIKLGILQSPETPIDADTRERLVQAANNLSNHIDHDAVPQFIVNAIHEISSGEIPGTDAETEWKELLELSVMMIDSTKGKEKKEWKELQDVARLMLGE